MAQAALLPGTLDLLILKAVSLGELHGYGVLLRIQQISDDALTDRTGRALPGALPARAPGPARHRVGHIRQQPPREVLPPDRRRTRRLKEETESWNRLVTAMELALRARIREV